MYVTFNNYFITFIYGYTKFFESHYRLPSYNGKNTQSARPLSLTSEKNVVYTLGVLAILPVLTRKDKSMNTAEFQSKVLAGIDNLNQRVITLETGEKSTPAPSGKFITVRFFDGDVLIGTLDGKPHQWGTGTLGYMGNGKFQVNGLKHTIAVNMFQDGSKNK
jgi:hypothetical protein